MKPFASAPLSTILLCSLFLGSAKAEQPGVSSIVIDCMTSRFPVSRDLYGVFYEEINRAGDGGLYAELLRNRSFEDTVLPARCTFSEGAMTSPTGWKMPFPSPESLEGWNLVQNNGSSAKACLDSEALLNPNQRRALRIDFAASSNETVSVENGGFDGVNLKAGETYRLTFWTKGKGTLSKPIKIQLVSSTGKSLAESTVVPPTPEWTRHQVELTSSGADTHARLRLSTSAADSWWLDELSLFPTHTFLGRQNGLRPDLVEKIADLQPAFLRFPGGCIVEGFTPETIWNWKHSLGDLADRQGHSLLWEYRTTLGLGFHEFLQLCEDLRMAPMYVFNCGMTCQGRNTVLLSDEQTEVLLKDALDAIEYANGSSETYWGAQRTKNGHPAPFNIRYVEIGNENHGPAYEERYARFYRAFHERYPEIRIIANSPVKSAPIEILDEHYYADPTFFVAHSDHYDSYSRNGWKVYVGEFAASHRVGNGNLRGAVSEAAFLTGVENNQDIVCMTSYAPLLANWKEHTWTPDAIYFDNSRSFGTPSYHLLQLFAKNRGDEVLGSSVATTKTPFYSEGVARLEISEGAEAKDFYSKTSDGLFREGGPQSPTLNSVVHLQAKVSERSGEVSVRLRDNLLEGDKRNYCILSLRGDDRSRLQLRHVVGWVEETLGTVELTTSLPASKFFDVEVRAEGTQFLVFIDKELVLRAQNRMLPAVTAVATRETSTGTLIVKVVNTTENAQRVSIALKGANYGATSAVVSTLTSKNPDDENSFEEPAKVSVSTAEIPASGEVLSHSLPPLSASVIRIPVVSKYGLRTLSSQEARRYR